MADNSNNTKVKPEKVKQPRAKSTKKQMIEEEILPVIPVITEITEVKQIDVSTNYSNLTLKELKQQVIDLGGPPLKTKQALINFLKKKV